MIPDRPEPFRGIYAATVAPLTPSFAIDEATLERHMVAVGTVDGILGLLINGHAGENFLLSREEKRRVVEIAHRALGRRAILVSGVNAENSLEAATHAADAETAGADAILIFPPNGWWLGQDERMAIRHHQIVAEACKLPLMLYQAPVGAGRLAYTPAVQEALLKMPRVVAVKEGSWEVAAYERTRNLARRVAPHVAIMGSGDEHLFTSFMIGSEGSQVSLAILLPEEIVALDRAVRRGDLAEAHRLHAIIQPLAYAIYGTAPGFYATARLKACLKLLGRIPHDSTRPPIGPLPREEIARLGAALTAAGLAVRTRDVA
ncbi:MAG: dihydrodipicolinate synthase family protein [Alphaproteobacteria bacterium]|nr:dihydrodipicolinate synthase family protein [Alphaproteobacteria bacterium]